MSDDDDDEAQKWANLEAEMSRPDPALAFTGADPKPLRSEEELTAAAFDGAAARLGGNSADWERTYDGKDIYSHFTPEQITAMGDDALFDEDYVHPDGNRGVLVTRRESAPMHTLTHEHERTEIDGRMVDIYRRRA